MAVADNRLLSHENCLEMGKTNRQTDYIDVPVALPKYKATGISCIN